MTPKLSHNDQLYRHTLYIYTYKTRKEKKREKNTHKIKLDFSLFWLLFTSNQSTIMYLFTIVFYQGKKIIDIFHNKTNFQNKKYCRLFLQRSVRISFHFI